ncbi:hypothetical protein B5F40_10385 [Gordonibacter sp. An230]|uniref:hypothetical protein n=1 Tax=Gordonibacter sp. An230 TaxID=1965592 RepID=UPI000B399F55|nr:hypothetical protein [Gordonibacter sp. An230]OUO89515.1 hypothetical protein B5F40_10385 [Gordonibacter sp. An230]
MALPHPSLTLVLDIDERLDSEALRLEVGRCYAHVCQTFVRTHPAKIQTAAHANADTATDVVAHDGDATADESASAALETASAIQATESASAQTSANTAIGEAEPTTGAVGENAAAGTGEFGSIGNIARFLVKMGTRRYLNPNDKEENALWNDVVERWIGNELHKVGNNMRIFNRRQREGGRDPLKFDWYELNLQNGQLVAMLRCDSASAVDPATSETITRLREAFGNGALGSEVKRVLMPAPGEYERQRETGLAAKAQREVEEKARAQAEAARAAAEAEAAERAAENAFLESPELTARAASLDGEQPGAPANEAERTLQTHDDHSKQATERDEAKMSSDKDTGDPYALEEADFALDYRLWQIEYADGSARLFDSATATFVEPAETAKCGTHAEREAHA